MDDNEPLVFDSALMSSGQLTVKKQVRELIGMETGDIVFLEIKRVVSKTGEDKFPFTEVHKEDEYE